MTAYRQRYSGARDFCESQHSPGLAVWDTEEKYLDLKFIVGREGRDKEAFTALYNEGAIAVCNSSLECDGKLVNLRRTKMYRTTQGGPSGRGQPFVDFEKKVSF